MDATVRACVVVALGLFAATAFAQHAEAAPARPQVVLVTSDCTTTNFLCPAFERTLRRTGIRGQIISPDGREDPVGRCRCSPSGVPRS